MPLPRTLPAPDLTGRRPLALTWPAGQLVVRVHNRDYDANAFWPGRPGGARFSLLAPATNAATRQAAVDPVPVLYVADHLDGALSESVFHAITPTTSVLARVVPGATLASAVASTLRLRRPVTLVDLTTDGLHRLGVGRGDLIETGPEYYEQTVAWAEALHALMPHVDGMTWVSRQYDTSRAAVLFGDRMSADDLELDGAPMVLGAGPGLEAVQVRAERIEVTISW